MGFFWDPNSKIPNPGDLEFLLPNHPEGKIPKNPKSPGLGLLQKNFITKKGRINYRGSQLCHPYTIIFKFVTVKAAR